MGSFPGECCVVFNPDLCGAVFERLQMRPFTTTKMLKILSFPFDDHTVNYLKREANSFNVTRSCRYHYLAR